MEYHNRIRTNLHEMFLIRDHNENLMYLGSTNEVFLKLKDDSNTRKIGRLNWRPIAEAEKLLVFTKEEKESNVFKKTDSWSIPWEIVQRVGGIEIITEKFIYKILTTRAKEIGSFLHFKESGIEKKLYIPRNEFNQKLKS
jgi:sporulation protein YlmC with PRC-barrel domain